MKATDSVKQIISDHLNGLGQADPLFAETLKKSGKNIDSCVAYIFTEVKKKGVNFMADAEVFAMAVHYYDEDDIKNVAMPSGVSAGHSSTGSAKAAPATAKPKPAKKQAVTSGLKSLFD